MYGRCVDGLTDNRQNLHVCCSIRSHQRLSLMTMMCFLYPLSLCWGKNTNQNSNIHQDRNVVKRIGQNTTCSCCFSCDSSCDSLFDDHKLLLLPLMEAVMFVNYVFLHADDCQDAVHVLSWVTRSVWCGSCRCFLAVDAEGRLIQSWLSRLSCRQQNLIPTCKQQQNLIPTCKQQNLIPCLTNQKHVPCHLATASPNRAIHHVILSLVISSLVTLHTAKASLVISSLVTLHTAKAGCPWKTMIGMSILVSELATCSWQRKSYSDTFLRVRFFQYSVHSDVKIFEHNLSVVKIFEHKLESLVRFFRRLVRKEKSCRYVDLHVPGIS